MSIANISLCNKCSLCKNQHPLVQKSAEKSSIFWVGLSAVKGSDLFDSQPLSPITNTGKLISEIEETLPGVSFYKTNAVKCLPLDFHGKIRYPTTSEMSLCFENMQTEISKIQPPLIVLLGAQVAQFVLKNYNLANNKLSDTFSYAAIKSNDMFFLPIHHPSYIQIYKRKYVSEYKKSVSSAIHSLRAQAQQCTPADPHASASLRRGVG